MGRLSDAESKWLEGYAASLGSLYAGGVPSPQVRDLLQAARYNFGPTSEHAAATLNLAGAAALLSRDGQNAAKFFKEARQAADMAVEAWIPDLLLVGAMSGLAATLLQEHKHQDAQLYFEKAVSICERNPQAAPLVDWQLALCRGEAYFMEQRYKEAMAYYIRAAAILNKRATENSNVMRLAYIQARAAFTHYLQGELDEAREILEAVLNLREYCKLDMTPLFSACISLLAAVFTALGKESSADIYISWGLESCQDIHGMESSETTEALNYTACYYLGRKDWSKAADNLRESLAWIDKIIEPEQTMWILNHLVQIAELQDDAEEQQRHLDTLCKMYLDKYSGSYLRDKSLVENGDQGAALQRQEAYKKDLAAIQGRYEQPLPPQAQSMLHVIEEHVWAGPVLAMSKLYALRLLDERAPIETIAPVERTVHIEPPPEPAAEVIEEAVRDPMAIPGLAPDGESAIDEAPPAEASPAAQGPLWALTVNACLDAGRTEEALYVVQEERKRLQEEQGVHSPAIAPLLEAAAAVYESQGRSDEAQIERLRAQLAACG